MAIEPGAGLAGIVAGHTAIATVGKEGKGLTYRGYSIYDLAEHSTFEEVAYLLIYGQLPKRAELNVTQDKDHCTKDGPLLDEANDGLSGTLGKKGQPGRVACVGCHVPTNGGFVDVRSPREQLSLGSGWTHRKAPSLLNVAELPFLMWDGRRDSAFSQVFSPIESSLEFNSSRLFVAQQVFRLYRAEYEAVFGPMPALLDNYPVLAPADAGCAAMPADPAHDKCAKPGDADDDVVRVVVNFGKAVQAFTRKLICGRSRFDSWMDGDVAALSADEQAGAALFVGKGACTMCHTGPYFTDRTFHNLGLGGEVVPFTKAKAHPLSTDENTLLNFARIINAAKSRRVEMKSGQ